MSSQQPAPPVSAIDYAWREKTISELFHVISQPLTGLHCLLEVSLLKKQKSDGYRRDIQAAIEAASRLVESLRQARELAEAENPGALVALDLTGIVRDVVSEFGPILESSHSNVVANLGDSVWIHGNHERLRRAIFYLFDSVLHDLPLGNDLFITTTSGVVGSFYIGASPEDPSNKRAFEHPRRAVAIAARTIESVGGRLHGIEQNNGKSFWVEFPRAAAPQDIG